MIVISTSTTRWRLPSAHLSPKLTRPLVSGRHTMETKHAEAQDLCLWRHQRHAGYRSGLSSAPPEGPLLDRSSRLVGGPPSLEPAYPSICVSPQIDMACPEIVR